MFYAFKTGNLLISVGQEAVGGKAAKVYADVSKVAGVWKEFVETLEDGFEEMWHHQHVWYHRLWQYVENHSICGFG